MSSIMFLWLTSMEEFFKCLEEQTLWATLSARKTQITIRYYIKSLPTLYALNLAHKKLFSLWEREWCVCVHMHIYVYIHYIYIYTHILSTYFSLLHWKRSFYNLLKFLEIDKIRKGENIKILSLRHPFFLIEV